MGVFNLFKLQESNYTKYEKKSRDKLLLAYNNQGANYYQHIINRGASMSNKVKITVEEVFKICDMEKRKKRLEEILTNIIKNLLN